MIKLAVFDMAGTTVKDQDNVHQALINAMAHFGFSVSREEANDVMGYPKPVAIRQLLEARHAGLPQRALLAELVLAHRLAPRDPLDAVAFETDPRADELLAKA